MSTLNNALLRIFAALFLAAALLTGSAAVGAEPAKPPLTASALQNASVMEINYYLNQMPPDELAAVLKMFRAARVVKSQYVNTVDGANLMTGSIRGMVNALGDPYSVYMDPKMFSELMLETRGSFGGVGIVLGVKDKLLTVVSPIEGTPAEAAGIISGDQIIRIDDLDTKEMALDEAVSKIRGPEGSKVRLTIQRAGEEPREFLLTRATIVLKSVTGKMLDDGMGYIRVSMFSETTASDFSRKMNELELNGMRSLVLDLRNNPGGLIDQCVKVAEFLVPKGPVVSVIGKDGSRETFESSREEPVFPLVVLINGGSASAAEIVAGAVQDRNVGKLVGVRSFGKGSVQRLIPLDRDSALKLTIAEYHTPGDRSIHGRGIDPDVVVEIPKDFDRESGTDPQLDKAVELLRSLLSPDP